MTLAAIGPNQQVGFRSQDGRSKLDFRTISQFGDITFDDRAFVRTTALNPLPEAGKTGTIQLWGNDATFNQFSRLRSNIAQDIKLNLTGTLALGKQSKILSDTRSSLGSGDIKIQAHDLTLRDGSQINASSGGEGIGGQINLNLQNRLLVSGISALTRESSAILSDGFRGGTGGLIQIQSPTIELEAGGLIRSQVFSRGVGGQVKIETDVLKLSSGSQISSTAVQPRLAGQAGSVNIDAHEGVYLTGSRLLPISKVRRQTAIRAEANGIGRAGSLIVNAPILEIRDGAQILTTTNGVAGNSRFNIRDRLFITGTPNLSSGIFSDSFGNGVAGPIQIQSPNIEVDQGGLIRSQVFFNGKGGNISIETHQLSLNRGSQISSSATRKRTAGQPGSIQITAHDAIKLSDSIVLPESNELRFSAIRAQSRGDSKAGDIRLVTPQLTLEQGARITNTSAGDRQGATSPSIIDLQVNRLALSGDRTAILSETSGLSPAGNISIHAQPQQALQIIFENNPTMSASSFGVTEGSSGRISVASPQSISISGPGQIAAETNGLSPGGQINLTSPTLNIQGAQLTSQSFGDSLAGDITLAGDVLTLGDRASLSTSSTTNAGGNIQLNIRKLVFLSDGSTINATAEGNGGNIFSTSLAQPWLIGVPNTGVKITADSRSQNGGNIDLNTFQVLGFDLTTAPQSSAPQLSEINVISASGRTPDQSGNINVAVVPNLLPSSLPKPPAIVSSPLSEQCNTATPQTRRSGFRSIQRGGLSINPFEVGHSGVWDDLRPVPVAGPTPRPIPIAKDAPLIEAQDWVRQTNGIIQLRSPLRPSLWSQVANRCHRIGASRG